MKDTNGTNDTNGYKCYIFVLFVSWVKLVYLYYHFIPISVVYNIRVKKEKPGGCRVGEIILDACRD